ncbi:MAG: hypothetical protein IT304_09945 [Dehalococcoidia bacterium]|nr:hypothetical protein [Dehalococcoidia bacterium]
MAQNATNATVSSVDDSATVVTLLAANASRLGACFQNISTEILYIKLGSAASLTNFTVKVAASTGYWEIPYGYVGIVTGIWANNSTGAVLITEFS